MRSTRKTRRTLALAAGVFVVAALPVLAATVSSPKATAGPPMHSPAALALRPDAARAAVTIVIQNTAAPGVGFNDPTLAVPVGGNPGTTLGQQRLNVFQGAANIWGANLNAVPTIVIDAAWAALSCNA